MISTIDRVRCTLRTLNPNETSGEWSVHDLAQATGLPHETVVHILEVIRPSARYVGGTSHNLYSLAN